MATAKPDGWLLGGRYRVLERVGRGGMAEVFRAHDELLDRDVAVKVFRTLLDDPDGATNGPARRELELQVMAGLNHPNLITLYDGSVTGDGPPYLVLEYVDGADLASRLTDGPMPEAEVREIGADLADALAYVHAHGLVHRDVKPANILLGAGPGRSGSDRARLSDFGIVRMIGRPQMTSVEMTVGTAYYIAPEQARGSSVGPEADVYALGLVLLEALSGVRAFDGPMHEALAARLTTTPRIPADLPAPWPGLLSAMTAMDPAARPDAATVAHELRSSAPTAVLAGLAAPAASLPPIAAAPAAEPTAAPVGGRRRFHPALLIAAAVFLVAAVAFGAFLLNPADTGGPAAPDQTAPPSRPASGPAQHHSTTAPAAT